MQPVKFNRLNMATYINYKLQPLDKDVSSPIKKQFREMWLQWEFTGVANFFNEQNLENYLFNEKHLDNELDGLVNLFAETDN